MLFSRWKDVPNKEQLWRTLNVVWDFKPLKLCRGRSHLVTSNRSMHCAPPYPRGNIQSVLLRRYLDLINWIHVFSLPLLICQPSLVIRWFVQIFHQPRPYSLTNLGKQMVFHALRTRWCCRIWSKFQKNDWMLMSILANVPLGNIKICIVYPGRACTICLIKVDLPAKDKHLPFEPESLCDKR